MAHKNYLGIVPLEDIEAFRLNKRKVIRPTVTKFVSHLLATWYQTHRLGETLFILLDGGEPLDRSLWHPMRMPVFHRPEQIRVIREQLVEKQESQEDVDYWLKPQLEEIISILDLAIKENSCIISVLQPSNFGIMKSAQARCEEVELVRWYWKRRWLHGWALGIRN